MGIGLGSGEWIMGPSVTARYGFGLFWLIWLGVVLQTIYNILWVRLVVVTGEPPGVLFSRIWPGAKFWAWFAPFSHFIGHMWPGWALAAATALAMMILRRVPGGADAPFVQTLGIILFFICFLLFIAGGKVEAVLEAVMKVLCFAILFGLIFILAPLTISGVAVSKSLQGFVSVGYVPRGVDILLLAGWWAYIGNASGLNWYIAHWYRDRGFGTASLVGYIPTLIGGKKVTISPIGKTFKITPENVSTFKKWVKVVNIDMWLIYAVGAFIGMTIPCMVVGSLLPEGTVLPAWGIAGHVANEFASRVGLWGFYLVCLIGFFVTWSTQLGTLDHVMRVITDIVWSTSESVRKRTKGDVRYIYYSLMALYIAFASWAIWQTQPLILLLLGANMANFAAVWSVPALFALSMKLPKELRPHPVVWVFMLVFWSMCTFFATALTLYYVFGIKVL